MHLSDWHHSAVRARLPFAHDGLISSLRAYSPSAFRALAASADSTITVEFSRLGRNQIVLANADPARRYDMKV